MKRLAPPRAPAPQRGVPEPPQPAVAGAVDPSRRDFVAHPPKWCSTTCRHRTWEQRRAAASGRSAVQVVERQVPVMVPLQPTRRDWPRLVGELADQLNEGRVYDRDLPALARALEPDLGAYWRRAPRGWSPSPGLTPA